MMRRRAFFGGKKEPVYIFKEGTGFDRTNFSYSVNEMYGVVVSANDIKFFHANSDGEGSGIVIGKTGGGFYFIKKFNWATDFPGYHTLFIECYRNDFDGLSECGLYDGTSAPTSGATFIVSKVPQVYRREILSFPLSGQPDCTIGALALPNSNSDVGCIYNIWLE